MLILPCNIFHIENSMSKMHYWQNFSFIPLKYAIRMFHMFFDIYYNIWFSITKVQQFTFLCNIIMPYTDFNNKSHTTFQSVLGNMEFGRIIVEIRGNIFPDSKIHGANTGPTWVPSAPDGPHVGPMNLAIWVILYISKHKVGFSSSLPGVEVFLTKMY